MPRASKLRFLLIPLILVGLVVSGMLAVKTYRAFTVLQSARALDMPEVGAIRAWMTIDFVASTYTVAPSSLIKGLDLPADTNLRASLRALAENAGVDPLAYVQRVQNVLADMRALSVPSPGDVADLGWIARLTEAFLGAFLTYGYPVLAVVLFLGAVGLPVPAGPLAAVAGTLVLQGDMNAAAVFFLGVGMSVGGDLVGYAAGRVLNPDVLVRWGRWVGYTAANRQRLERLFASWGGVTLILTRSLIAHIGVVASLLAGVGRYDLKRFFAYSLAGRMIWTGAYLGLGYAVGSDFEAASGFLARLSLLLLAVAVTVGTGVWVTHLNRPVAKG